MIAEGMETTVYIMEVADTTNIYIPALLLHVSNEKKLRLEKFPSINSKLSIFAELLIRRQVIEKLGLCNNEIVFDTNEHGKPMLVNNDKFYFNISYTHNIIVLVISEGEIGVDVEKLIPCNFKIIDRFFTKHEKEYIFSSFSVDEAFTEIWTKKEAYTKYKGTGLSMPLRSFCVFDKAISDKIYTINIKGYFISFCENLITSFKIIEINELDFLSDEVSKLI